MAKNILYFGGSFDPIGNHHLILADLAREQGGFDEVCFIPTFQPPHKAKQAPFKDRFRWITKLVSLREGLSVSDIEQSIFDEKQLSCRPGSYATYTKYVIDRLIGQTGLSRVPLLVGGDSFKKTINWYDADRLYGLVDWVVYPRDDTKSWADTILPSIERGVPVSVRLIKPAGTFSVSSTLIRKRIREKLTIQNLVPECVHDDILSTGGYAERKENEL